MRAYDAVALGLMARWIGATRDGDMVGGDLPGWLPDLIGPRADCRRSPTGAANASTPPVRIITAASSRRACAARGAPASSSPTMRW